MHLLDRAIGMELNAGEALREKSEAAEQATISFHAKANTGRRVAHKAAFYL